MRKLLLSLSTIAFAAIGLIACKKDDTTPEASFNGYKIDGKLYEFDFIEHDFYATGQALRIHTKSDKGDLLYFRTQPEHWPSQDGVYSFGVHERWHDSTEVNFCFEPADRSGSYCSVGTSAGTTTTLTITVKAGKWALRLPPTQVYGDDAHVIEIDLSEK
jgi:hypothetical protein